MIVVSDTTPLHYLVLIGQISILPAIFSKIIVPNAVVEELSHDKTPNAVKQWMRVPPAWVEFAKPDQIIEASTTRLGAGELESISLAIELDVDGILMDDRRAILEARRHGLPVITSLTILVLAARRGLLDFDRAIEDLNGTTFRMPNDETLAKFRQDSIIY